MSRPWWQWALGWLGLAGLIVTLFFYVSSGLVAPFWAIIVLLLFWLLLLVVAIQLLRQHRPAWVLAIPVVAFAVWFGALSAGEAWLGWTA